MYWIGNDDDSEADEVITKEPSEYVYDQFPAEGIDPGT